MKRIYKNNVDSKQVTRKQLDQLLKGKVIAGVRADKDIITLTLKDRARASRKEYELSIMQHGQVWNEWEEVRPPA